MVNKMTTVAWMDRSRDGLSELYTGFKLYITTSTVPNQNYPQGVFNPVYACFTVVEDTRCILRMHNERIYSVTLVIHNSCITHDAHRV